VSAKSVSPNPKRDSVLKQKIFGRFFSKSAVELRAHCSFLEKKNQKTFWLKPKIMMVI
jgi:hypothetical protein